MRTRSHLPSSHRRTGRRYPGIPGVPRDPRYALPRRARKGSLWRPGRRGQPPRVGATWRRIGGRPKTPFHQELCVSQTWMSQMRRGMVDFCILAAVAALCGVVSAFFLVPAGGGGDFGRLCAVVAAAAVFAAAFFFWLVAGFTCSSSSSKKNGW